MRLPSLALLLLGGWLCGSLILWFVATRNFRTPDRILEKPTPQAAPVLRAQPEPRPLLRHLASELNRLYFRAWGYFQLALGAGLLAALLIAGRRTDALLCGTMLALVAFLLLLVTPPIISLGREIDFLPRRYSYHVPEKY